MTSYGRSNVWIAQAALVCGLGRNPLQAALCARARLGLQRATDFPDTALSTPTRRVWDLPDACMGFDRLTRLARAAFAQLDLGEQAAGEQAAPLPLLLALPARERPDDDPAAAERFLQVELEQAGQKLDAERTSVVRGDHASGAQLLQRGADLIERGEADRVLVGGVDSYHHPEVLRELHERAAADTAAARYDPIMPGEAACFLLLTTRDGASCSPTGQPLAQLCAALTGQIPAEILEAVAAERRALQAANRADHPHERHRRDVVGPSGLGSGWRPARRSRAQAQAALRRLTSAARRNRHRTGAYRWQDPTEEAAPDPTVTMRGLLGQLRSQWPGVPVDWSLPDLNRERERSLEWQRAAAETLSQDRVETRFVDELGDVGAATAPTLIALACAYWDAGCAPARAALVAVHSSGPARGVVLLQEARHARG